MQDKQTYRQIMRSTSIIGVSSVINILFGLVRTKVVAVILGPSGIGLYGLINSFMFAASMLAGMGLANSGVRQIAASNENPAVLLRVSRALRYGNIALGLFAAAVIWLLREEIAQWVLSDRNRGVEIAGAGVGVLLLLITGSQTALLQGLRKIKELAVVSILAGFSGTAIGVAALWWLGEKGILVLLIVAPATSAAVAYSYTRNLLQTSASRTSLSELVPEWRALFQLGIVFMLAALMTELTNLAVRSLITKELGISSTGYFQASWAISMQYINFVLGAMAADYYPRLTQSISDKGVSNGIVVQQIEFSFLLAAPIILVMIALAPWVISLLYSDAFSESVSILRWQILGDVFKVASWPLGFILIARSEKSLFFLVQCLWLSNYLLLVWLGLPHYGLEITGIAFLISYVVGFSANYYLVRRITGFTYGRNTKILWITITLSSLIMALSYWDIAVASVVGSLCAFGMLIFSLFKLAKLGALDSFLGKLRKLLRCT